MDETGFRLIGLRSTSPIIEPIELEDIDFLGTWASFPATRPSVTNFDPDLATIEWTTLAGGDPVSEAAIRINLSFVPEPGTALLLGLALAGLGVVGRPWRTRSQGTA